MVNSKRVHRSLVTLILSFKTPLTAQNVPQLVCKEGDYPEHNVQMRFRVTPHPQMAQTELVF